MDNLNNNMFNNGIEFQKKLDIITRIIQDRMLNNLSSIYPKDRNTNLAVFYRALAEELARTQVNLSNINEDRYHDTTRPEYLFLILGDSLFLDDKAINETYNDQEYRNFLIKVRNAYFGGSRKDNIESAVSDIIGLPVTLKEVYLYLRNSSSSYTIKDTHKMFFDILMDDATTNTDLGAVLSDLKFFIDLIKPAHVLYDTRLIWTDTTDNRGDCTPEYDTTPISNIIYYGDRIFVVTYLITTCYTTEIEHGTEGWETGTIYSKDEINGIIYTTDNRILVYNSSSLFYHRDIDGVDTLISVNSLEVGNVIKYYATKDSSNTSELIGTDWEYTKTILSIDLTTEILELTDGSKLVINNNTLVYTRDGRGEYRLDLEDLQVDREIIFRGKEYTSEFKFYNEPQQVQDNYYKQFDQDVIDRPYFQGNVEKVLKTKNDLPIGPDVIYEDGVAKVVDIDSKFYKRDNEKSFKNHNIYRYSLFIDDGTEDSTYNDDTYKAQFSIEEPQSPLTLEEATDIFYYQYGYTGIGYTGYHSNPDAFEYRIDTDITSTLIEATEDTIVNTVEEDTMSCEQQASCDLYPFYEDTRKYWTWSEIQLTSGFIVTYQDWDIINDPGEQNVPAYFIISTDPNEYVMPYLPVLNEDQEIASKDDLIVYVNGVLVEDAIETLDPWTGIITLNFIPPFNTTIRVDYYYAARYPSLISYRKEIKSDISELISGDMGAMMTVIGSTSPAGYLYWPYTVTDIDLKGTSLDYQMDLYPILNREGNLASSSEVSVYVGSIVSIGTTSVVKGTPIITRVTGDWSGVSVGDEIIINAKNYLDYTLVYIVEEITDINTIVISSNFPDIDDGLTTYSYKIINYGATPVEGAVESLRPLLGHVTLTFLPPAGSVLKFDYYYTHYNRNYQIIPDDLNGYLPDIFYGSYFDYTLLPDQSPLDDPNIPITDTEIVKKIGYRYRVFNLSNTSVLNSSDTLSLNSYEKPAKRVSFANRSGVLNEFNLMFSPEYLKDSDPNIILNDKYLEKELQPVTELYEGTPPFIKTFSDDAHYKYKEYADETDTYQEATPYSLDLNAGFTIIDSDKSGDIDYNPVCAFSENERIDLYSDLKMVEHPTDGYDLSLSTISEGSRTIPLKTTMIDKYYPNREQRINDYLDYVNKVPEEIKTGNVEVLNKSKVIKSHDTNFLLMRRGDKIVINDVSFDNGNKDLNYTITEIYDYETAEIHAGFGGPSGEYSFELIRDIVIATDVVFGGDDIYASGETGLYGFTREIVFNSVTGINEEEGFFNYGISDTIMSHFPEPYKLNFTDPDPDLYPRNPWGFSGMPTGDRAILSAQALIQIYGNIPLLSEIQDGLLNMPSVTGIQGITYILDSLGVTGSYMYLVGLTGLEIGLTGPVGAIGLGITGPIGDVNPRIISLDDVGVVNIPVSTEYPLGAKMSYGTPSGETGSYLSYSEAEYRVQWRNWDQDMVIIGLGGDTGGLTGTDGIFVELPLNMMDDLGEGIRLSFWNVNSQTLEYKFFHGSIIETSELVSLSEAKGNFPDGVIYLNESQSINIENSDDPLIDYPDYHLNDAVYNLYRLIIREILQDNSVRVTEIRQYIPI